MDVPVYLSKYKLGKTLGIGAFGKVKLAHHIITGQKVAVKILNKGRIKHMEMAEKVRREINILKMCTHPHIIRLYEVIDTPTDIFVIMEYVSGGELFDYIVSRGRLPADEARSLFHQILSSVEYCHFHKIVHRDLKPENLLLDADNNIKLADFGLSNVVHDGEFLRTSCGSPNYAAPEVISGNLYAGPEVDVWSCGVILYALLCGTLPFDDESIPNLFKKIKAGMYSLPAHLSQLSRDLILHMLVVDPMKRITIADIRAHPWFQHKLPMYLTLPPEAIENQERFVDEEILSKVCELPLGPNSTQVSESVVLEAIAQKHSLQVSRFLLDVRVAYELLLDAKRHKQRIADVVLAQQDLSRTPPSAVAHPRFSPSSSGSQSNSGSRSSGSGAIAASPLTGSSLLNALGAGPKIRPQFAPTSQPLPPGVSALPGASVDPSRDSSKKRRWFLGIQSKKDPGHVMTEVYKALLAIGCKWYAVNNYRIVCSWKLPPLPSLFPRAVSSPSATRDTNAMDVSDVESASAPFDSAMNGHRRHTESRAIPIPGGSTRWSQADRESVGRETNGGRASVRDGPLGVSMVSVASGFGDGADVDTMQDMDSVRVALSLYNVQQHIYLLDFQRSQGDSFSFMKLCALIITELKNLAAASRGAMTINPSMAPGSHPVALGAYSGSGGQGVNAPPPVPSHPGR